MTEDGISGTDIDFLQSWWRELIIALSGFIILVILDEGLGCNINIIGYSK
jgi:hypothetical protein